MELRQFLGLSVLLLPIASSLKILTIFPSPSPSHNILGQALAGGLAKHGHDVTMVSPFIEKNPISNYTQLEVGDLRNCLARNNFKMNMFSQSKKNDFLMIIGFYVFGTKMSECATIDPVFTNLLQSKDKYDIVIVEGGFFESLFLFARHFDAPLIVFSSIGPSERVNYLTGNPTPYAYVPHKLLESFGGMNFFQRAYNTALNVFNYIVLYNYHVPTQDKFARGLFGNDIPQLSEYLKDNVSLVLLNSHISLGAGQPLVPNMIEIGGFHVQPPKALPGDLKKMLDEAKQGVIYFSMGSNLQSANLPETLRDALLKVFGERKELVLWKWDDPNLPGKPDNVIISKWYPQSDLLAHPNIKLFITHGGLLSTTEAVTNGVPLLGLPIFGDQINNMKTAESLQFALKLDWSTVTYDTLKKAINEMISNPSYMQNAKHRSALLKDQPLTPVETAAYWVEYVARHKGAKHLRVQALNLKEYQLYLVDVVLFYLAILSGIIYLNYWILKKILLKWVSKEKVKVN